MVDVFKSMFVPPTESIIKRPAANNQQFCCRIMPSLRSNSFGNQEKLKAKSRFGAPVTRDRSFNECVRAFARLVFFSNGLQNAQSLCEHFCEKAKCLLFTAVAFLNLYFEYIDRKLKLGYIILRAFLRKNFGCSLHRGFANSTPQGRQPPSAFCLL